jgi:hypothetical protein
MMFNIGGTTSRRCGSMHRYEIAHAIRSARTGLLNLTCGFTNCGSGTSSSEAAHVLAWVTSGDSTIAANQNARDILIVTAVRFRLSLTGYAPFEASAASQVRRRLS